MASEKPSVNEVEDEQSMEEILQSIRRIIAEEDEQQSNSPAAAAADEEVLELTELFEAEELQNADGDSTLVQDPLAAIDAIMASNQAATAPKATPYIPPEVVPETVEQVSEEFEAEAPPSSYMPEDEDIIAAAPAEEYAPLDALISNEVAHATANSIKAIRETAARAHHQPKTAPLSFRSGTTVEDLILEAVRPMLKEWLDANLPQTVERIIAREIHRLVEQAEEF